MKNMQNMKIGNKIIKVLIVERQKPHKKQFVSPKPASSSCMQHAACMHAFSKCETVAIF
jgi:hypothetical protein